MSAPQNISDRFSENADKPDFRELDLGSPISPLRARALATQTTSTSSSSSSSGSLSGRPGYPLLHNPAPTNSVNLMRKKSHSGELSSDSSFKTKPGHKRSDSSGSLVHTGSGSVTSPTPPVNALPAGNICPSGRILKPSIAPKTTKTDVLGSGGVNYGHGSIMKGGSGSGSGSRPGIDTSTGSRGGLMVGGDKGKRMGQGQGGNFEAEEMKRMGNESYKKGCFVEALRFYDRAISLIPGNAIYRFNRAVVLIGLKRVAEAVRECEEAIKLDPGYVRAHHRLGSLLVSLGEVESARKHICFEGHKPDPVELQKLQSVEKHIIKCIDARRVGDWRITLREADAAIASGADFSPQLCACRAEALLKLNLSEDAFIAISKIPKCGRLANYQSNIFGMVPEAYVLFVRTKIELAKGRFDNAIASIEKAGELDPRNREISVSLNNTRLVGRARARGNDLFNSERYTEACSAYGEGIKLDPSISVLYCNRAACWFKLAQWEKSVDDCNKALRIQPNYIKALLRRGSSNAKLEKWSEAVSDYELLRRELPDDKGVAESLFHFQVALRKSRGEDVSNMKFGGDVELVSSLDQFRAAISSPGASVVLFKMNSNVQCKQISPFLDTLCTKYPSINFLTVDIEENVGIVSAENVRIVPTFKIYRKGNRVKEMVCPSPEVLESSVRHYSM